MEGGVICVVVAEGGVRYGERVEGGGGVTA